MKLSSRMSAVTSWASVNERIHSSSSNSFEVGSFSLLRNINYVLSNKRRSSGKSPVAHLSSKQASSLSSSCEGDNGVQLFLPFASRTKSTHWQQFDVGHRRNTCFAPTLLPHRAPRQFVSPSFPGNSSRLGTLRTGGMSSNARAPWDEGRGPVPAAVRSTLRSPVDQSLRGFAGGASGCQGTCSLPALFVCLRLRLPRCSAQRPGVLLTQDQANQSVDLSRFS